jgi:carboxymethylenebutenolidase
MLSDAGVAHDVKEYTDAGHSFLNDHDPDEFNALVVMLARISNSRYHEPSAQDARQRIVAFFDSHLRDADR